MHIPVDAAHNKIHNEFNRDAGRLKLSGYVLSAVFVAAAIIVYFISGLSTTGLLFAASLLVVAALMLGSMIAVSRRIGDPQDLYDTYPLAPAIVAAKGDHDLTLMALVRINDAADRYALAVRPMKSLGHPCALGDRVATVAVPGRRSRQGTLEEVSPMPVDWATPDTTVWKEAIKNIPGREWNLLEANKNRFEDVRSTRFNLLPL